MREPETLGQPSEKIFPARNKIYPESCRINESPLGAHSLGLVLITTRSKEAKIH